MRRKYFIGAHASLHEAVGGAVDLAATLDMMSDEEAPRPIQSLAARLKAMLWRLQR